MLILLSYLRAVSQGDPGVKLPLSFMQANDPRPSEHAFPAICAISGRPAVTETDAVQFAPIIVDVIMPGEGTQHIASFEHRREQSGIHLRAAYFLILAAVTRLPLPDLLVLRQRDMEKKPMPAAVSRYA